VTTQQGLALGLLLLIGYGGWFIASICLYLTRKKNNELENKIRTLDKE